MKLKKIIALEFEKNLISYSLCGEEKYPYDVYNPILYRIEQNAINSFAPILLPYYTLNKSLTNY